MIDSVFKGVWIFILGAFILIISAALGAELCTSNTSETERYSSYCDCGGMYKMVNAENLSGRLFYFWQCDECGRVIKTDYLLEGGAENETDDGEKTQYEFYKKVVQQ